MDPWYERCHHSREQFARKQQLDPRYSHIDDDWRLHDNA